MKKSKIKVCAIYLHFSGEGVLKKKKSVADTSIKLKTKVYAERTYTFKKVWHKKKGKTGKM